MCSSDLPVSSALVGAAFRHGLALAAGPRFGMDGAFEPYLRLPYAIAEPQLEMAVERLATAWSSVSSPGERATGPAEVA